MIHNDIAQAAAALAAFADDREAMKALNQARLIATRALANNKPLLFCGNGGSFADAAHAACELVGRFRKRQRQALPAIVLGANSAALTAIANDFDYHETFAREVEAFGSEGAVLFAISTSGDSVNVCRAAIVARSLRMDVVALTGSRGGKLAKVGVCNVVVRAPVDDTPLVQACHGAALHALCGAIEDAL